MNDFLKSNARDIGMICFLAIGAYFTIQSNTEDIISLQEADVELESNKVGNSTMILKEQFLQSELGRIEEEIKDLNVRLDKKIKIISAQQTEIHLMSVKIAVQQAQINQGIGERSNIWQNYNRINCK